MSLNRRKFLQGALVASTASVLPVSWVFAKNMPAGVEPLDINSLTWTRVEDLPEYYTMNKDKDLEFKGQ